MRRHRALGVALVGLVLLLTGCNAGRAFIASSGDYADYRAVRTANDVDARMAAAWEYLETRPDGRYAERLRSYFDKAEPVFFKVRSRSVKGLEAYLRALPNGPHADEAVELLMGMRDESRRESLDTREVRAITTRLDAERDKRESAAALLLWWLDAFADQKVWDKPLTEAPAELVVRYDLSLPQPRCDPDPAEPSHRRCVKPLEQRFRVPGNGKLEDRTLAFLLETELDERWRLVQLTITGAGILLATEEARSEKALGDGEAEASRAAAAFVAKLTATLFEREVACNGGTDARGRTVLTCEGLRLTIEPGRDGGDDVMWIRRSDQESTAAADDDGDDEEDEDDDEEAPPAPLPAPAEANEDEDPYD